ncbi:YraN family protein [Deltaproteobacteria bacterium OttesenSCG-928-M10]|nr:YraN family protein [Deltaproteobacteria bacterium OttesenSCG-928-M10]
MDQRHELGRRGEDLAADYLKSLGYRIVGRNLANRIGELDLVAEDGRTVVVVEVKTRSKSGRPPAEAVDGRKRRKLTLTATLFLQMKKWDARPARFDVVEVVCPPGGAPIINHIKDAFEAVEY